MYKDTTQEKLQSFNEIDKTGRDDIIELPEKIVTNESSDFKSNNFKLNGLLSLLFLLLILFVVSAVLINNYFADKQQAKERIALSGKQVSKKFKSSLNKKGKQDKLKKYREIITRYNNGSKKEERVEIHKRGTGMNDYDNYKPGIAIKVKLGVLDVINYINLLARLNGFYRLERFTLGKRDPNLVFAGEVLKRPNGQKSVVKKRDFLWKYAILDLKRNYRTIFFKILKFKKKIRMFEKRKVDNFKKISIMKQGLVKVLNSSFIQNQRDLIKVLINRLDSLPVIYK